MLNSYKLFPKTRFEDAEYLALDTESTGLDAEARLLSLAWAPIRQGEIRLSGAREYLNSDEADAPVTEAARVHGILGRDLERGAALREALEELLTAVEGKILVGHHIAHDAAIVRKYAKALLGKDFRPPLIDTGALFVRLHYGKNPPDHLPSSAWSLDHALEVCQIPVWERHTAAGDCLATALLFLKLCHLANKRGVFFVEEVKK